MVKETQARTLLNTFRQPDPWFGLRFSMNLYRGCQHQCVYCDSRSQCYGIEDFSDIQVKANALDLLHKELARKRIKGTIGTGSMHDPYIPIEAELNMTGRALEIIAQHRYPVHVTTKSDLVLRDLDTLRAVGQVYAAVSFTVTTADDNLCQKLEPGAPPASRRFQAMATLAAAGILTGVTMMPILPFIEDTEQNVTELVEQAASSGAHYVLPMFGMTMRDRQRAYYYEALDRLFPGVRTKYERMYGDRYVCTSPREARLAQVFRELCDKHGVATRIPFYGAESHEQLRLL